MCFSDLGIHYSPSTRQRNKQAPGSKGFDRLQRDMGIVDVLDQFCKAFHRCIQHVLDLLERCAQVLQGLIRPEDLRGAGGFHLPNETGH